MVKRTACYSLFPAATAAITTAAITAAAITECASGITGIATLFIKLAGTTAKPYYRPIGLYFAFQLAIAACSTHDVGVTRFKVRLFVRLEAMGKTATGGASVYQCNYECHYGSDCETNCQNNE
tara:strand:- start:450 stop:818 length:369 start_codon:yes stop_codon:yes gene_type:complete